MSPRKRKAPAPEVVAPTEPVLELAPAPVPDVKVTWPDDVRCGWCTRRDAASGRTDGIVYPPHQRCTYERCECPCRQAPAVPAPCDHTLCRLAGGARCMMGGAP